MTILIVIVVIILMFYFLDKIDLFFYKMQCLKILRNSDYRRRFGMRSKLFFPIHKIEPLDF